MLCIWLYKHIYFYIYNNFDQNCQFPYAYTFWTIKYISVHNSILFSYWLFDVAKPTWISLSVFFCAESTYITFYILNKKRNFNINVNNNKSGFLYLHDLSLYLFLLKSEFALEKEKGDVCIYNDLLDRAFGNYCHPIKKKKKRLSFLLLF